MTSAKDFDGKAALARMRARTNEAREHEAGELFSAESINAKMSAAAAKGQSAAYFEPTIPMDLSESETAKSALQMLQSAGFNAEWKTRQKLDGEPDKYLRVSWGNDAKPTPKS